MSVKLLREQRAVIAKRIQDMAAAIKSEDRNFNSTEQPQWQQANSDYDALTTRITAEERALKVGGEMNSPASGGLPGRDRFDGRSIDNDDDEERTAPTNEDMSIGLQAWMLKRSGLPLRKRHIEACRRARINPNVKYFDINLNQRALSPAEFRAMSAINQTAGASTIAPTFASSFELAMLQFGGVRQAAEILRTDTGAELTWPTANDTTNEGHIVGENTAVASTDIVTGAVKWGAYKFTSDMIKVPVELLEDSAFDMATIIGQMAGERIGRYQNRTFTSGDGASKPTGFLTAGTLGVTTASATAITYAEVTALEHSVDPAYRTGPNVRYMFNDQILLYLRQLTDTQGRPLWQTNVALGAPDTFNGQPYSINQNMDATAAATNKTMAFGDFSKYKIRDVRGLRLRRLVERYADLDQEGFVAFFRSDGNVLNSGVAPIKYLQQHA